MSLKLRNGGQLQKSMSHEEGSGSESSLKLPFLQEQGGGGGSGVGSPNNSGPTTITVKTLGKIVVVIFLLYQLSSPFWQGAFLVISRFSGAFDRAMNHLLYQYIDGLDEKGEVTCMNYGYFPPKDDPTTSLVTLDPEFDLETERYCLQMYHKLGSAPPPHNLTGLDVLEVGSGRGGGASYIQRHFHPHSTIGLDYSSKGVAFCNKKHAERVKGLSFVQGDAINLPFEDASFDVVVNVESSHCYESFPKFLNQVHRVLKPGGYFSWADFRAPNHWDGVNQEFANAGFVLLKEQDITSNVVEAMTYAGRRNKELIDRAVPAFARSVFYSFAGLKGTHLHNQLSNKELIYTHKLLQKKV